jgi:hypothetical protein
VAALLFWGSAMSIEITAPMKWEPNAFYDRLIALRRTDRKTFDGLSTPTHYALAEYEKQRYSHRLKPCAPVCRSSKRPT